MASANQELLDAAIRHAHSIERFKAGEVRKILGMLNRDVYPAVIEELQRRLSRITVQGADLGLESTKRLRELGEFLDELLREGFDRAEERLVKDIHGFSKLEAKVAASQIERAATVALDLKAPGEQLLRTLATQKPFAGSTLAEHFEALTQSSQKAVRKALNIGMVSGETFDQIAARVTGTRALAFKDGALEMSRRQVKSLVGSAVQHAGNSARQATYAENSDVIKGEQWHATLDSRTCFPAGTLVETISGPVPIESIRVGDLVLTIRGRYRAVIGTMRRRYTGPMVRVRSGRLSVSATADHLFHDGAVWREIRDFKLGDLLLQRIDNRAEELGSELAGRPLVSDPHVHGANADGPQGRISPRFLLRRSMPVVPVYLKSDGWIDQEVNRVASRLRLWSEAQTQFGQRAGNMKLGARRSAVLSVAAKRAELAVRTGTNASHLSARLAGVKVDRATALFGAVEPCRVCGGELDAAGSAFDLASPALAGAPSESGGVAGGHLEIAPARGARLLDPSLGGGQIARPRAVAPLLGGPKGGAARRAGHWGVLDGGRVVARRGAVAAMRPSKEADSASRARLGVNALDHLEQWSTTLDVFDIQVHEDESFVANGFVVHNCPQCQALDGKEFPLGEGPQPPLHLGPCRCVRVPVLKSWRELGIDADELDEGTRSSLNGEVPESQTYPEWLKRQPQDVQDAALGPERAALFRSGEVTIDRFVDDTGRLLTLEELARLEGLDL